VAVDQTTKITHLEKETAEQTTKITSLEAELKIARLEKENA